LGHSVKADTRLEAVRCAKRSAADMGQNDATEEIQFQKMVKGATFWVG
jgi:hypothetical protein